MPRQTPPRGLGCVGTSLAARDPPTLPEVCICIC